MQGSVAMFVATVHICTQLQQLEFTILSREIKREGRERGRERGREKVEREEGRKGGRKWER